jgi:hypothetical protein
MIKHILYPYLIAVYIYKVYMPCSRLPQGPWGKEDSVAEWNDRHSQTVGGEGEYRGIQRAGKGWLGHYTRNFAIQSTTLETLILAARLLETPSGWPLALT